jgi:CHAD domain-containing protein
MRDKLGQELPETEEETKDLLADLKLERFALVRSGAPVAEVDALRRRAHSLQSWLKHFEEQRESKD